MDKSLKTLTIHINPRRELMNQKSLVVLKIVTGRHMGQESSELDQILKNGIFYSSLSFPFLCFSLFSLYLPLPLSLPLSLPFSVFLHIHTWLSHSQVQTHRSVIVSLIDPAPVSPPQTLPKQGFQPAQEGGISSSGSWQDVPITSVLLCLETVLAEYILCEWKED